MSVRSRAPVSVPGPARWFFGVLASPQTYRNLVYLALTFPLGLFYFTLLVTGASVGYGLLYLMVGVPVLVAVFLVSDRLLVFERWLAAQLLGTDVPIDRSDDPDDVWDYVRHPLGDLGTWIGVGFLLSKFVVGIVVLLFVSVLWSFGIAAVLAPLYYRSVPIRLQVPEPVHFSVSYAVQQWGGVEVISYPVVITSWQATTLTEALALSVVGAVVLLVSLHLCNGLATVHGWYVRSFARPRPLFGGSD